MNRTTLFAHIAPLLMLAACSAADGVPDAHVDREEGASAESTPTNTGLFDSLGRELGAVSAAVVRANEGHEPWLLARIEVQPNELLEFYEPAPGVLLLSGAGAPAGDSPIAGEAFEWSPSSFEADWRTLAGDAPVPAALTAAVERARAATAGVAPLPAVTETVQETAQVDPAWEAAQGFEAAANPSLNHYVQGGSFCESDYYTLMSTGYNWTSASGKKSISALGECAPEFYYRSYCYDHYTGNTALMSYGNSRFMRTNVCPYRGSVVLTYNRSGSIGSFTVAQNTYRWAIFVGGWGCEVFDTCGYTSSRVTSASGDGYHFRYEVNSG